MRNPRETDAPLSSPPFRKEDFNPEIGEAHIEKMAELGLFPVSEFDSDEIDQAGIVSVVLRKKFRQYFPEQALNDFVSRNARAILRNQPDVELSDLLTRKEKDVIRKIAKRKTQNDSFRDQNVIQELEEAAHEKNLCPNGRWWVTWITSNKKRKTVFLPHGYAAECLFLRTLRRKHGGDRRVSREFSQRLRTSLRDLCETWGLNLPTPNTYEDIVWRYLDGIYGDISPSLEHVKCKIKSIRRLNVFPYDGYFWSMFQRGSNEREQRYKTEYLAEANRLIERGVSADVFEHLERNFWFNPGLKDAKEKAERLRQPFFLIAFLLKEEYPNLYRRHLREAKSFVFNKLLSKKGASLRKEKKELEQELQKHRFRVDMMSEGTVWATELPDQRRSSIAIQAGSAIRLTRRAGTKPTGADPAHPGSEIFHRPEVLNECEEQLRQVERKYERKQKELMEENLREESEIIRFKAWLESDFLLACVFFCYVFEGLRRLRLKRAPHRPSRRIVGNMIVYLVDVLAPHFMIGLNERNEKAQLHRSVSIILHGLTGEKLSNRKVRELYRSHS